MAPQDRESALGGDLFEAARELHAFCTGQGWRYCIIGGLAVQRWGEIRATGDVDATVLTGFGGEGPFVDAFFETFPMRREDGRELAAEGRVVLIRASNGVELDISLAGLPTEERILDRASDFEFLPGLVLPTASAEDLVVMKAVAGRGVDERDIAGIIVRQGPALDWSVIESELSTFAVMTDGEVDVLPDVLRIKADVEAGRA